MSAINVRVKTAEFDPSIFARELPIDGGFRGVALLLPSGRPALHATQQRNEEGAPANWRFRTEDAHTKLRRLYTDIDS